MSAENRQPKASGSSPFSLFIDNVVGSVRKIGGHFNTTKPGGKRNVIILSYALAFLGLHTIWAYSKGFREDKAQAIE